MATGIKVGPLTIRYYGIVISAGILAALLLTQHLARRREKQVDELLDALPWMFLGGLLGVRLWHILTPPESMVQQGITILQETMVTMACDRAGIDHTSREWSEFAGKALNVKGRNRQNARLHHLGEKVKELEEARVQQFWNMIGEENFHEFLNIYMMLTQYRNYINHAGTLIDDKTRPVEFVDKLRDAYGRLIAISGNL